MSTTSKFRSKRDFIAIRRWMQLLDVELLNSINQPQEYNLFQILSKNADKITILDEMTRGLDHKILQTVNQYDHYIDDFEMFEIDTGLFMLNGKKLIKHFLENASNKEKKLYHELLDDRKLIVDKISEILLKKA